MEKYEKPRMEVVEIENEMKTIGPGLPGHGETGDGDANSTPIS